MDLKRWKIFDRLDPTFAADIKRLYLIGMNSRHDLIMEKSKCKCFIPSSLSRKIFHERWLRLLFTQRKPRGRVA